MLAANNPAHFARPVMEQQIATQRLSRKRRPDAAPENNERLSKRLALLNLEQSGTKLYVPVESQQQQLSSPSSIPSPDGSSPNGHSDYKKAHAPSHDSMMELDNSKYKVYIRNLDDELSSDSESDDGRLIFLPDIEKHLRNNRIPPSVFVKPDPDALSKQLVLYSVPSSLTIPEEQDSVRKAIIEARARARTRQIEHSEMAQPAELVTIPEADMVDDLPSVTPLAPPISQDEDEDDAMELD